MCCWFLRLGCWPDWWALFCGRCQPWGWAMSEKPFRLVLPYAVSSNRYWRVFGGRVCHSKEALDYRRYVALIALREGYARPFTGDVAVSVALCPEMTAKGVASKTRLDLDNCLKVVLDALQGVAFNNDKQIVELRATLGPAQVGGALMVEVAEV